MSDKWKKILLEVLKYSLGAVLGGLGITLTGCACVPCFNF